MKMKKNILILQSFFAVWALMLISGLNPMNILGFLLLFLCLVFFTACRNCDPGIDSELVRNRRLISRILGFLFTLFYLSDVYHEILSDLSNPLFQGILLGAATLGLYFLFSGGVWYLMFLWDHFLSFLASWKPPVPRLFPKMPLPLLCLLLCLLCRIPFLLYSYPGIMTPDSINQLEQVLGMVPYSNHHPFVHTMTISLFYHLGTVFASTVNGAFVFYTLFQILFMVLAPSYLILILEKYVRNRILLWAVILFYALMPYHNVMAVCIWKDVMFAGILLFFSVSVFHLIREGFGSSTRLSAFVYALSGIMMCLYRSNGWYAFLVILPFLLIVFRKQKNLLYPLHFFMLAVVLLIKGPVMDHYGVTQPDFVESVSIPLQQVCRVVAKGYPLTSEQEELLGRIMDIDYIDDLYAEHISDNMKELVRAGNPRYLASHKADYLKLWIELGLTYPGVYLDAYIEQTRGYYSPSAVYSVAEVEGIIENDTGVYAQHLLRGRIAIKLREILIKLHTIFPLYGAFWSMGSLLWMALLSLALTLGQKKDSLTTQFLSTLETALPWLPGLAVITTLLIATPVAIEFRYAYSLAYCIPLYFALMLFPTSKKESV